MSLPAAAYCTCALLHGPYRSLQGKSMAAENAIKLTVFQADSPDEVEAPALAEPVKRESVKKAAVEPVEDATEIIKKWTKK